MPGLAAIDSHAPFEVHAAHSLDNAVTDLCCAPGGDMLFSGTAGGMITCFDHNGVERRHWQAHDGGLTRLSINPTAPGQLASAGEDGRVVLWNTLDGALAAELMNDSGWVEHLAWSPREPLLAVAARKTISVWRGSESLGIWYDAARHIQALAWAPDGRRLATAANKGLYLWQTDQGMAGDAQPMQLLSFPGAAVTVAWQPRGRALAVGTQDGFLQIWRSAQMTDNRSPQAKASQLTMRGYPGKVNCLAWHPHRPMIATAGGPDVVLWELPSAGKGSRATPLRHHQSAVTALAWSDNGELLASGDRSGRLCIWDGDAKPIFIHAGGHEITKLQWLPESTALVIGDVAGSLTFLTRSPAETAAKKPGNTGGTT